MGYERTRPPYNKKSTIPEDYNWASLIGLDGLPLERHYRNTLENLGKEPGILGSSSENDRRQLNLSADDN